MSQTKPNQRRLVYSNKSFTYISFQSNCHVPLKVDQDSVRIIDETFVAVKQFLKPKLDTMRKFLTLHRLVEFDMNPECMEVCFVIFSVEQKLKFETHFLFSDDPK